MRARFVEDDPAPEFPRIGTTIIAKRWPRRHYLVSTICLDGSSDDAILVQSLKTGLPYGEAPAAPDRFVTQVVKCDEIGFATSFENPLYQREYLSLAEARAGHAEAVAKFSR